MVTTTRSQPWLLRALKVVLRSEAAGFGSAPSDLLLSAAGSARPERESKKGAAGKSGPSLHLPLGAPPGDTCNPTHECSPKAAVEKDADEQQS